MNSQLGAFGGALLGIVGGGYLGFTLGKRYRAECARGRFWVASAASVLLGMLIMFGGYMSSAVFVSGLGLGLMTGGLNGLRWGMGRLSDVPRKKPPESDGSVPLAGGEPPEQRPQDQRHPRPVH